MHKSMLSLKEKLVAYTILQLQFRIHPVFQIQKHKLLHTLAKELNIMNS